jgi:hypothetical protein
MLQQVLRCAVLQNFYQVSLFVLLIIYCLFSERSVCHGDAVKFYVLVVIWTRSIVYSWSWGFVDHGRSRVISLIVYLSSQGTVIGSHAGTAILFHFQGYVGQVMLWRHCSMENVWYLVNGQHQVVFINTIPMSPSVGSNVCTKYATSYLNSFKTR